MKSLSVFFTYLVALSIYSCQSESNENIRPILQELNTPCQTGGEPSLYASETGDVYLTWVEYLNDSTDALFFSILENEQWSSPKTIATGSNWFVNWADFPSLVTIGKDGNTLVAHWLQKSAEGTYDYDVHISQSMDGGNTWDSSFIPHRDSISAEHGFVSMLPLPSGKIMATWLDGRNTKPEGHTADDHGHGHHGAMTLRTAEFDEKGILSEEAELDNRICDCCQTSAALTDQGIIIAYRDRSEEEVRDISVVRKVNGKWTAPQPVSKDNWLIAGCPVNGPAIAANESRVAVAWFTMQKETPQVKIAFSSDSGASFGSAIQIDEGNPLGRVDVVLISENEAMVSWLEQEGDKAILRIVLVNQNGDLGQSTIIAELATSRESGFPRMVKKDNQLIFAWTNVDSVMTVKTAILGIE